MQIQIAHNPVLAKLIGADRNAKLVVQTALSYVVDGAAYISTGWDGRQSFFNFAKETFPAGFVYLVYKALLMKGYKVRLVRSPFPAPLGPEYPKVDDFPEDPRYNYQHEVPRALLKHGQIIAQISTGGGKTRAAKLCYGRIARPTLFLTTRSILLHQMKHSVETGMNEPVSVIGDDAPWPENPTRFTVGMVQTLAQAIELQDPVTELERYLANRQAAEDRKAQELVESLKKAKVSPEKIAGEVTKLRDSLHRGYLSDHEAAAKVAAVVVAHNAHREKALAFLQSREFVILEEAHESSSDGYYELMKACRNAHYRLALTATPFMRDSSEANMKLMACSGPVAVKVSEEQLINLGVLATPYFKFVKPRPEEKPKDLYRSTPWPRCHEVGVVDAEWRNRAIVYEARRAAAHGLSVMILVTRKKHGRALQEQLTAAGLRVNFIFGEHEQDDRQAALNALKSGRIQVLIGSTILDVGVDVPAVGMIILAGAGKAEVGIRQRIGRGLREKKNGGPNVAFIVDFEDDFNNTLREHARDRRMIIQMTSGFRDRVVADFDYPGLGFGKLAA